MRQLTKEEIKQLFGRFEYKIRDDGHISFLDNWVNDNLRVFTIPQLKGILTFGGVMKGKLYCHKNVGKIFCQIFKDIEDEGLLPLIKFFSGCVSHRLIRGSLGELSTHCWAISMDLNHLWNRMGTSGAAAGEVGSIVKLIPIFNKHGFLSGLTFPRKDPMHFEPSDELLKPELILPEKKKLTLDVKVKVDPVVIINSIRSQLDDLELEYKKEDK